jgi:hypothetical protein
MRICLLFLAIVTLPFVVNAQVDPAAAVAHMEYLSQNEEMLSKKYLSYMSEVAHGHKARKMEKRREDVISTIREAVKDCQKVRPYNGDASLRDAQTTYYSVLLSVFTEDYAKIVDMEEVAERSYDAMEAYLMIQEKVGEKLDEAFAKLKSVEKAFAEKNNIRLTQPTATKVDRKLAKIGKVNNYMNQVYLIFFKSAVQETLLLEALNKNDINALEQCRASLAKFATEGLTRLDTVKAFEGDGSLINGCRKVLEFQKSEAENKIPLYSDFLMQADNFEKARKAFESTPASSRTKGDVDAYNATVTRFNKTVNEYNVLNNGLNNSRDKVLTQWETTRQRFMHLHVPH